MADVRLRMPGVQFLLRVQYKILVIPRKEKVLKVKHLSSHFVVGALSFLKLGSGVLVMSMNEVLVSKFLWDALRFVCIKIDAFIMIFQFSPQFFA